jgi:glycosyltransferase involved in cell wall biosynthesis
VKIFVAGTRGIPDIPGGIESHCQELFPRVAERGHQVYLCTRSPYVRQRLKQWKGVHLVPCFAPRVKSLEAIVHTFIALIKARLISPDLLHIHGIGPALLTPFARIMGLRVVVTNHGPDYARQKWGKIAKTVLRLGEFLGCTYANEVIVVSPGVRDIVRKRCRREPNLILNGVSLPNRASRYEFLTKWEAIPDDYILAVARFVPEKGLHDLVSAFKASVRSQKLLLVGDADHETEYSRRLLKMVSDDKRIILTGYITGEPLHQAYSHARLFVLPSYHEGLPIVLLEALSYGLPVLASDIPANREIGLPPDRYYRCGDVNDLREKMSALLEKGISNEEKEKTRKKLEEQFDWDRIADQTAAVYKKALPGHPSAI